MILGITLLLRRLSAFGGGALAIMRITLDEALRAKVVIFGAFLMIALVAGLPTVFEDDQPLRYQIQTYLNYSLYLAGGVAGVIVVLFAVWTAAKDVEDQRAHEVFVKPLPRWAYLVGRWLGAAALGLALTAGASAMIGFTVARGIGSEASIVERGFDAYDRLAIRQQVLVARGQSPAEPDRPILEVAAAGFETLPQRDKLLYERLIRESGGDATDAAVVNRAVQRYAQEVVLPEWTRIAPQDGRTFVFRGLEGLRTGVGVEQLDELETVQLRYRIKSRALGEGDQIGIVFVIGGIPRELLAPVDQTSIYDIDVNFIDEDGTLTLSVLNSGISPISSRLQTITLESDEDAPLQIMYEQGGFGSNLLRATFAGGVRLTFLAMLGTVTGALMSLPVAALLSLSVWLLAAMGSAIQRAVGGGGIGTDVAAVEVASSLFAQFALSISRLLSVYSDPAVGTLLADGRWLTTADLLSLLTWVGLLIPTALLLLAWLLFSRREIARVQV